MMKQLLLLLNFMLLLNIKVMAQNIILQIPMVWTTQTLR